MSHALVPYQRELTDSRQLESVQDRVEEFLRQVYASDIITGRLIEDVAISSASTTTIEHKLGRTPRGVILVKTSAQCDLWQPTPADDKSLYVRTSVSGTFNLWVF